MAKYLLRYSAYNDKVNLRIVGKRQQFGKRDDDVMGSHASLWLWNRATWEKLNSLDSEKEEKDFPDPREWEKRNKWDG